MRKGILGYHLFNNSDDVYVSPETFKTKREAWAFARVFRERFKQQGYYKTADGWRIKPSEVELTVIPVE